MKLKANLLIFICLAGILSGFVPTQKDNSERPNIIFIITDDQQVGLLGVEGNQIAKTPNIDRIAEEGMMFTNFFSVTPLCSPSRASFLTGQYAYKHGVINNDKIGLDVISHTLMTWPRQLREAGYHTAFIGKWHMGLDDSRRIGYDRWLSFKGQGVFIDGVVNDDGIDRQTNGNMTEILNEEAVKYINQDHENKPFAMILSHKALHWPLLPSESNENKYADVAYKPVKVKAEDLEGKPLLTRNVEWIDMHFTEGVVPEPGEPRRGRGKDPNSVIRDQMRCLNSVDEGVGSIFEALEKNGQLENTIIIYTSDNGMLMGQHGEFHQKRWAYEESLKIPFLIRYPKMIEAGSKSEQMVLNVDLAPTIYELTDVEPILKMHGLSFLPLLKNENPEWRDAFLAEYFLEKVARRNPAWKAIRTNDWKYIAYPDEGKEFCELYSLKEDLGEEKNLYHHPEYKEQVAKLEKKLEELMNEIK